MERVRGSRKDRTGGACPIADRDHVIELLVEELRDRLAPMPAPVDAELAKRRDRARVDLGDHCPGGVHLKVLAAVARQQRLGNLAARGVVRAHEEHADRVIGHGRLLPAARLAAATVISRSRSSPSTRSRSARWLAMAARCCGEERREVGVDGPALEAQSGQTARVLRSEAEASERHDEAQTREVDVFVVSVSVRSPRRRREDALSSYQRTADGATPARRLSSRICTTRA